MVMSFMCEKPQEVKITKDEQRAIRSLERLAKKWPKTLSLFSWSGTLCVCKKANDGRPAVITQIIGIDNDGGDPSDNEIDQDADIFYS